MASKKALESLLSGDPEKWGHYLDNEAEQDTENNAINGEFDSKRRMVNLSNANLSGQKLDGYRFSNVDFSHANLEKCSFKDTLFEYCVIDCCMIFDTDFSGAVFTQGRISDCVCNENTSFKECTFQFTRLKGLFEGADFRFSGMRDLDLQRTSFLKADLRGATLRRSNLSGTSWDRACIDKDTEIELAQFEGHPVTRDKSQAIRYSSWYRKWLFNWKQTRAIGSLPIFEFSWFLFLASLFFVNVIGTLNNANPVIFDGYNKIPIPEQVGWVIFSAMLLAIGSTVYKIFCPEQVREFSEAQWVYEHGHPRIEYLSQSLQKPALQIITLLTLTTGGGIGLWMIVERIFDAISYLLS